ncbi:phosphatase PAP2 family protein [Paucibacter sp. O1-1]|nr:phosphatase PAP2 family protein [Paucibacter sp. O1-1]MDA3829817.1 phosphatase PAP2 family protein [Paucibacter sp. O1-1]
MTATPLDHPLVTLATQTGAQALPVFLALLMLLLLATAALWWSLDRHLLPRARSALPASGFVLLNALAGFGLLLGGAGLFAEIAEHLGRGGTLALADEALTASIRQHVDAATLRVFAGFTRFGDVLNLSLLGVVVTLLLLFKRRHALALGWVLALGGNGLLNPLLKRIFERARPVHDHGLVSELGWSFPSGHSSGAVVAYGMLAYLALRSLPAVWHLPAVLAAAALVFTVGCSRVFLQVHFATDVAAGFASGLAWLSVCIVSVELGRYYRRGGTQRLQ